MAHSKQIKEIEHENMVMRGSCKCEFECARAYHPHRQDHEELVHRHKETAGKPRTERPTGGSSVHYGESEGPRKMKNS